MLETRQFCDVEFVVGPDEVPVRILAHVALVAARSQWLRTRIRQSRENRDKHLEKVFIILFFQLLTDTKISVYLQCKYGGNDDKK